MPDGFPCPNPTCSHTFPPAAVKGSGVLNCPRCGTVYKFRQSEAPKAAKPTPPAPPVARPVAAPPKKAPPPPPPVAAPVAVAPPVAPPVRERTPDPALVLDSQPEMVMTPERRRKNRRRRGGGGRTVLAIVLIIGICSLIGLGIFIGLKNAPQADPIDDSPAARKSMGNFAFEAPRGWKQDRDLQLSMHVNLALSRKKPRSHFALAYRDYKTRTPGDGELLNEALKKLRGQFTAVNYENPFESKEKGGRTGSLGGEPAVAFPFVATDRNEVSMKGEVVLLARQGYAYWLFTWGPDDDNADQLPALWESLREGFKLFNNREGWTPKPRESTPFAGSGYRLNYFKDLWRKEESPKDYDPACELALKGFEPTQDEETGKKRTVAIAGRQAVILAVVMDRAADDKEKDAKSAYKTAEAYFAKKEAEVYPNVKFEVLPDPKTAKPQIEPDVGALRGQLAHLRVLRDADTERYGILAVAGLPDNKFLAIYAIAESPFESRDFWRHEIKAVIATVRRAKE
jgi:hypothetical protein